MEGSGIGGHRSGGHGGVAAHRESFELAFAEVVSRFGDLTQESDERLRLLTPLTVDLKHEGNKPCLLLHSQPIVLVDLDLLTKLRSSALALRLGHIGLGGSTDGTEVDEVDPRCVSMRASGIAVCRAKSV